MSESRHKREPGTPPRFVVVLAALALVGATGAAVWFLPAQATQELKPVTAAEPAASTPATPAIEPVAEAPELPSAFVSFVDTARQPDFNLPANARRTGIHWFTLGHLVAGGGGCAPKWGGQLDPGSNPVANRIGRLRAEGADAGLAFGGAGGRELAAACTSPTALAAAYRRVIGAFNATFVDFEIRDSADTATTLRRARAIRTLQDEQQLQVSFTLPLERTGLSEADQEMLRATHEAGARIATVNLLTAIEPQAAPAGRMRRIASAVRAAQGQIAQAQQLADPAQAWRRIALTSVLVSPADLSEIDARKLTTFCARYELAWLSLRGAAPGREVSEILWRTRT